MPRGNTVPLGLTNPVLRERHGAKATDRSFTSRMTEIIERLGRVTGAHAPDLHPQAWELICCEGWDALVLARLHHHDRPQDIDVLAWGDIVTGVADWIAGHAGAPPAWSDGLVSRLHNMPIVERIAVLERIEAYGRVQAVAAHARR